MTLADARQRMNELGGRGIPFFVLVDFEMRQPLVWERAEWEAAGLRFRFPELADGPTQTEKPIETWTLEPPLFAAYRQKFDRVYRALQRGDSYLVNLTDSTRLLPSVDLALAYRCSEAKYKVWMPGSWVCFSPEQFVRIENGTITTCPMKGTIDSSLPAALEQLMADEKEVAEHVTVVDLLRNDLARVANRVEVARFRFATHLKTNRHNLWQVSSEIRGRLNEGAEQHLGDILFSLLPAGSVSGAPKARTLNVIADAEQMPRGYYTGVAGYYNGVVFDSCVLIRFIEQRDSGFFYRSGGGITLASDARKEYEELVAKVYVPVA